MAGVCRSDAWGWKLVQRITKGTLRATEAWTDGRYAEDDKYVELDYELAVALAKVTEGAARATVLKVTRTEQRGSWHVKHWLTDMRPSRRTVQQQRCNPYLRRPRDTRMRRS